VQLNRNTSVHFITKELDMKKNRYWPMVLVLALSFTLSACGNIASANNNSELEASGTFSARTVDISPQIGGELLSINVEEGQQVEAGDELFRLDDQLLKAQYDQATAAVQVAEAALNAARSGLESAQVQYEMALDAARLQDQQQRALAWQAAVPEEFSLPVWYYQKFEEIAAAEAEVADARRMLDTEQANLQRLLESSAYQEFIDVEKRLGEAQAAFLIAQEILDQAKVAQDKENLETYAQEQFDAAKAELEATRSAYDQMLTSQAAADILEARGRVTVAQARYDAALDHLSQLNTGEQSLQVKAAEMGVKQAEAAIGQAEAALEQARSAARVVENQLEKSVIQAPVSGIILARNAETGETVSPGSILLVIGQLEEVELIVYIPETEYGRVNIGDQVTIVTDSFPGESFRGTVVYISDQAEFTPRNVQTVEGRRATVYAVKLSVPNPDLKLKPGMPADVTFLK
jgi:multidrug resistance efflux pump